MSFPINPANGQIAVVNNIVYAYNSAGTGYWTRTAANTSTLGITIASLNIQNTSSSTSTFTGALVVAGGVGIGGTLYAGNIYTNGTLISTSASTGTTSTFFINNTTVSTSTNTGALVVSGGVGIGGALYVSAVSFINNAQIITTATIGNYANTTIINAGTDTAINTSTGIVTVWNTSTLQTITNRGSSTTNAILISNPTSSTNTNTGALTVVGGVGVGGNLAVGGIIYVNSVTTLPTGSNANLVIDPDGVGDLIISTATEVIIYSTLTSISTTTGALVVTGGVGIGGSAFINTTSYIAGSQIITTASINQYIPKTTITAGTDTAVNTSTGSITIWDTSTLQSVTSRGNSTNNAILITNPTSANSTNSGALQVSGGVGIGGALYVNTTSYIFSAQILTTATINQYVTKTTITAGTDTAVNTSTGSITIWDTSTLQSVTSRGNSTDQSMAVGNYARSNSTLGGALVVRGGVGVTDNIIIGSDLLAYGGATIGNSLSVGTTASIAGSLSVDNGIISRSSIGLGPNLVSTSSVLLLLFIGPTGIWYRDSSPIAWSISGTLTYNVGSPGGPGGSLSLFSASNRFLRVVGSGVIGDPLDLSFGQPDWTVEFWFSDASAGTGIRYIIDAGSGANSAQPLYSVYLNGTTLYWTVGDGTTTGIAASGSFSGVTIYTNQWWHFALVRFGNTITAFITYTNSYYATTQQSVTLSSNIGSTSIRTTSVYPLLIGAKYSPAPTSYFTGFITKVRIVKKALYQAGQQITPPLDVTAVPSPGMFSLNVNYFTGSLDFIPNVNYVNTGSTLTPAVSIKNNGNITISNTLYANTVNSSNLIVGGFQVNSVEIYSLWNHNFYNNLNLIGGAINGDNQSTIALLNTAASTSTNTGALTVAGGVGIGGNLYVGGTITANKLVIQLTTITTTLVQTDDIIQTYNTTNATEGVQGTGALRIGGGASIASTVNIGGNLNVGGTIKAGILANTGTSIVYFNASTGEFTYGPNYGSVGANEAIIGNTFSRILYLTTTTNALDANSGGLKLEGGIGAKGSIYTAQKIGWTSFNSPSISQVYQFYNPATGSLDTIFG